MTIYSSIHIGGERDSSSTSSAIFENDQLNDPIDDPIDRSPLLGDSIQIEDDDNGTASYFSCAVG